MKTISENNDAPNEAAKDSAISIDDPKCVFVPLTEAIVPPNGLIEHLPNKYWAYVEGKGILYFKGSPKSSFMSPQCNSNKEIAEHITEMFYPWATVLFVPSVFRKVKISEYT
jgi:hypothetical protein